MRKLLNLPVYAVFWVLTACILVLIMVVLPALDWLNIRLCTWGVNLGKHLWPFDSFWDDPN